MSIGASLHEWIENYNILTFPTEIISNYLTANRPLYKLALIVNHIFRACAMTAFCQALPFASVINALICFEASLFYRLTVEINCAYKFALPAFAGSIAIPIGLSAIADMINGLAFASLYSFVSACISLVPLIAYITYIVLTVNYDADN
jgi:hypothetical protein